MKKQPNVLAKERWQNLSKHNNIIVNFNPIFLMKNLDLQMNFNTNIASMDFSKLRTDNISDYENPEVLEVIYFDVSKVLNCLDNGSDFEKGKFIVNNHMNELIKLIRSGEKIIPPFLVHVHKNKWTLVDGNHRLALMNYLGITNGPFLIRKNHKEAAINL